ncbi:hypothetical protein [Mycobacterium basiliense]|uniref:hypothetical protein n=1 Tax=Mycobacterium basiliense TaxID=2094119 RepID=UPI0013017389|nr:hypothetical protein [Mycobacterium basiliense]
MLNNPAPLPVSRPPVLPVLPGRLKATGRVIDTVRTTQRDYYGSHESAFPKSTAGGRGMLLLSNP